MAVIIIILALVATAVAQTANSSSTAEQELGSKDPEIFMNVKQIIERWNYPVEEYEVQTDDGYLLSLFRIPHGRNVNSTPSGSRPVVFLQHGLESSAADWIVNLPNQAAGFVFADAGFDVWLGNFRGNTYGKRHVSFPATDDKFWQFSWDEMAHSDLPALVDKVINITGEKTLYYIGHSMGTQTAFAKLSSDPEFARKIRRFYALGPVTTVKHIKGPLRLIAPLTKTLSILFKLVGINEFFPNNMFMDLLAKYYCGNPVLDLACKDVAMLICGPESNQLNATRMPVYVSHTPAGTSTQNIVHYGQMVISGLFQMFDYGGGRKNKDHYGQDTPPIYDLSKMQTPVVLYWSDDDWLADPKDVEGLIPKLPNIADNVYLTDFNHLDFLWGLRAAPQVYFPIIRDIRNDMQRS